jgi:predicted GH43/DUF377 family glycosyl hydrolase
VVRPIVAFIAIIWTLVAALPASADSPRTWTHTTQADFMDAERRDIDVRVLDALGTPYGYDADPRGSVRLWSRPDLWTKYGGNPVLDIGPAGSWDDAVVDEAKVVFDGQQYHMWYLGRKASGDSGGILPIMVGYATSPDATHWTKHPGNPVLRIGPSGSYDSLGIHAPFVLFDGQTFRMWYSAWKADAEGSAIWSINTASSPDGTAWTKDATNPLMVEQRNGRWDATYISEPSVLWNGVRFEMWYNGGSERTAAGGRELRIGYALSTAGLRWRRRLEDAWVLDVGEPGAWDDFSVARAHVIYDGLRYQMWYEGHDGANFRIGQATSQDGLHWAKDGANPILELGPSDSWDSIHADEPYVLFDGQLYRMWYSGYDGEYPRIGLATAPPMYARQGTLVSAPIDGGRPTTWRSLSWQATLPEETEITLAVATGDDGRTWSRWHTVASGGQDGNHAIALDLPQARYFRYRATLTTADPGRSPVLEEVTVSEEALPTHTPTATCSPTSTPTPSTALTPTATTAPLPTAPEPIAPTQTVTAAIAPTLEPTIPPTPMQPLTSTADEQTDPRPLYVLAALALTGMIIALGAAWHRSRSGLRERE